MVRSVKRVIGSAFRLLAGKRTAYVKSAALRRESVSLSPEPDGLRLVKLRLLTGLRESLPSLPFPAPEERGLLERLRQETEERNRNNVTRTNAYWRVYARCPTLHWALLSHMVSRNAGWSMTDLKGELLPRLLGPEPRADLFRFLETANAFIFQDAYPQLRLYEESRRIGRPLFHLLDSFSVSRFMRPVWEQFWRSGDSALLTEALIVNEQHFIEERVVQAPFFRRRVIETDSFRTQSWLQLNQVVFPYAADALAGLVLERFDDLKERIACGKSLYAILFGIPSVLAGVRRFAAAQPHTGSRADYWPQLFGRERPGSAGAARYTPRLDGVRLRERTAPFYSPELPDAWPELPIDPPERHDWFVDRSALRWFGKVRAPFPIDMTNEYGVGLAKLELAVVAKEAVVT